MSSDNFNLGISNIILDYSDESKDKFRICLKEIKKKVNRCGYITPKRIDHQYTYVCDICGRISQDFILKTTEGIWMRPYQFPENSEYVYCCVECIKKDVKEKQRDKDIIKFTGIFSWTILIGSFIVLLGKERR